MRRRTIRHQRRAAREAVRQARMRFDWKAYQEQLDAERERQREAMEAQAARERMASKRTPGGKPGVSFLRRILNRLTGSRGAE